MTDPELTLHSMIDEQAREWLLRELRFPVLAIVTPNGAPNQSVMWFDLDPERRDTIVMNTKSGRAKNRWSLRARGSACSSKTGSSTTRFRGGQSSTTILTAPPLSSRTSLGATAVTRPPSTVRNASRSGCEWTK